MTSTKNTRRHNFLLLPLVLLVLLAVAGKWLAAPSSQGGPLALAKKQDQKPKTLGKAPKGKKEQQSGGFFGFGKKDVKKSARRWADFLKFGR